MNCTYFTGPPPRMCRLPAGHDGDHDFPTVQEMLDAMHVQGDPSLHPFKAPDPEICVLCHRPFDEH